MWFRKALGGVTRGLFPGRTPLKHGGFEVSAPGCEAAV
jgi:hypothetical protein